MNVLRTALSSSPPLFFSYFVPHSFPYRLFSLLLRCLPNFLSFLAISCMGCRYLFLCDAFGFRATTTATTTREYVTTKSQEKDAKQVRKSGGTKSCRERGGGPLLPHIQEGEKSKIKCVPTTTYRYRKERHS